MKKQNLNKKTWTLVVAIACIMVAGVSTSVWASDFFNGFETDISGWDVFGGTFDATRVPSGGGTLMVTSASGSWHAESGTAAGNWGGYGDNDSCASAACAAAAFPALGYDTAVDIYLDVDGGFANDTRFDFSSAINEAPPSGLHRRDFIFNCGFYNDDTDSGANGTPDAGANRFICSASNNSQPGSAFAKNPDKMPTVVATATGWYTFLHEFRDNGSGVLTVDLSVLNSSGTVIKTWTLSDATDLIATTVGGNRYGWFDFNEFPTLALDNAQRTSIVPDPSAVLDHFKCYEAKGHLSPGFVDLEDQFGVWNDTEVKKAKLVCIPVNKNGEEIKNPDNFILKLYEIKVPKGSPKFETQVIVTDQFGEETVTVKKPKYLAVPALKEHTE